MSAENSSQHMNFIFFYPDYTVGLGISPNPDLNHAKSCVFTLADYTANRESHPALKIQLFSCQINYRLLVITFKDSLKNSETFRKYPLLYQLFFQLQLFVMD